MWKSEEMIITIIPLYSRKSVSLVILSLSVETSCWWGGPVVNRDPTLSPQSPFSLLSFVILLGAWHKYWRQIWKDVISLAERRMKGYPYIINRLIIWMFWLKCKDERRTRITDLVRGGVMQSTLTQKDAELCLKPQGLLATRIYASGHAYIRVGLHVRTHRVTRTYA